ncbi:SDR family NAD(P)-dependent oxidoreductase [Psychromonas algicola]|uniref:SDR family NAD(P)-dependent oxidoreductase n=1 Tax=Psychromonas algicola TaxID=2555642 RepID=UPI00141A5570|nr:SDR family NAD(P)-dependent oxidoreductase [Psychromonas sp. RZ5]
MIPKLVSEIGELDILMNNAGLMHAIPFDDYPQDKLNQMLKLNIEVSVALIGEVSKGIVKKGYSHIGNNGSFPR